MPKLPLYLDTLEGTYNYILRGSTGPIIRLDGKLAISENNVQIVRIAYKHKRIIIYSFILIFGMPSHGCTEVHPNPKSSTI